MKIFLFQVSTCLYYGSKAFAFARQLLQVTQEVSTSETETGNVTQFQCFSGHFSALVPSDPYQRLDAAREEEEDVTFLPLMDCENKLIPIHFLSQAEVSFIDVVDMTMTAKTKTMKNFISILRWATKRQSCDNGQTSVSQKAV